MGGFGNFGLGQHPFGLRPLATTKPKVFVSYHHQRDQGYYDLFTRLFADGYDIITDTSIERRFGSDDVNYQQQVIREQHITGSSVTIVLCGAETWKRRWVDWEIHMTLNKQHALLGISLPTNPRDINGKVTVPDRLHANIVTDYAHFIDWTEDPNLMRIAIDAAKNKARQIRNIDNSAPRMERSRS
ncbi:MAG: TIR domain-containing protein [Acidobacteriia bacterium]|nr:TIR domain-containing protein [Terriglobia bacterium]